MYISLLFVALDEALDGDLETLDTLDGAREGDRIGLEPLKKLELLFTDAGDGGICARVSRVRSDSDGRISRRPRASCADATDAVSSSPAAELSSSEIWVSPSSPTVSSWVGAGTGSSSCFGGAKKREEGFFTNVSYDGRRNLRSSNPVSARSLSRDGDGLIDFGAVLVGKGSREAGRGMPLAGRGIPLRRVALGCPSIVRSRRLGGCRDWGAHVRGD